MIWPALLPASREGIAIASATRALVTYELRVLVGRTAAMIPPGDGPVVVACEDRLAFVVGVLAGWCASRTVALPATTQPAHVTAIAEALGAVGVWSDRGWVDAGGDPFSADAATATIDTAALDRPLAPDRVLALVYTSGSTAAARATPKTAAELLGEATMLARHFAIEPGHVVLAGVPLHHIYGLLFGMLAPLLAGATIVAHAPLHAEAIAACVANHRVTHLVSTPTQLRALEVLAPEALQPVTRVFSSGAPLPAAVADVVHGRFGLAITEILGSSETGGIAWRLRAGDMPPWQPLPGATITCDDHGRMHVDSPWLPPACERPFATADRIRFVEGGFVHLGRLDDVVKIGGRRLALSDVEARLRAVEGVDDAAVLALPTEDGRGQLVLAVVGTRVRTPSELRAALEPHFEPVLLPRRIVCVEILPREPTGKLVRARLELLALTSEDDPTLTPADPEDADARFDVAVPSASRYFDGHFDGDPVLAGVVLLEAIALRGCAWAFPELGRPTRIARVKFRRRVIPGDRLVLALRRHGSEVDFEIARDDGPCAAGEISFAP